MGDPKESETKKFLRKRAPFYIAGVTLLLVFVVPEITKGGLQDIIPDTLGAEERVVLDHVLRYAGPNDAGLSMEDAITQRIKADYPDGNVFDHRATALDAAVTETGTDSYRVVLNFESYDRDFSFDWNVNMDSGQIQGNNDVSKDIVDLVDFYD